MLIPHWSGTPPVSLFPVPQRPIPGSAENCLIRECIASIPSQGFLCVLRASAVRREIGGIAQTVASLPRSGEALEARDGKTAAKIYPIGGIALPGGSTHNACKPHPEPRRPWGAAADR